MLKKSKYNHFLCHEEEIVAYNARTNALAQMTKEDYALYKKSVDDLGAQLRNDLKHGGFLVDESADELNMIKHNMFISKFSTKQLGLTIAPTSNCNFRCPYCYEKDVLRNSSMTDETASDIVQFVKSNANSLIGLNVTWYGGEPLLEMNRIEQLSKEFLKICQEYNIEYEANIVTNGYLLNDKILEKLMNLKVKSIQITLDGIKTLHDQTRYLIGKKPTFDTIINNLKSFKKLYKYENFPGISIRMNINRKNYFGCKDLILYMHENELDRYCDFYPAIITDMKDTGFNDVYTVDEFERIKEEVKQYKEKINFRFKNQNSYPIIIGNWCVCDMYNSFVVDSDGSLYKCWELMGNKENSIGNISNFPVDIENCEYYENLLEDPTMDKKCADCDILPICNGGSCPIYRKRHGFKPNCEVYRKTVHDQVLSMYKTLKDNIR